MMKSPTTVCKQGELCSSVATVSIGLFPSASHLLIRKCAFEQPQSSAIADQIQRKVDNGNNYLICNCYILLKVINNFYCINVRGKKRVCCSFWPESPVL